MKSIEKKILSAMDKFKDIPAIFSNSESLSWLQLFSRAAGLQEFFDSNHIRQGDIVTILARPSLEYITLLFGGWMAGLVMTPLSTRWPDETVLDRLIQINCKHLVTKRSISTPIEINQYALSDVGISNTRTIPAWNIDAERSATLIFTSGSSSSPKAVLHTLSNHFYNALGSNSNITLQPGDRWLLSLPFYHVSGIAPLFRCQLAGAAVALPTADTSIESSINKQKITHISLVSTQFARMLEKPDAINALKSLKAILLGGSAIPSALVQQAVKLGLPIHTSYGSTEMASQITTTQPDAGLTELGTGGRLLPHREITFSEQGEILVRGKTLLQGYLGRSGLEPTLDENGWFHTGDRGHLDEHNCLHITGRMDNMFISGGENIQPEEIETCIELIEGIEQCIVVPVPDTEFGHRPVAFVKYRGNPVNETDLRIHLHHSLERFKHPIRFMPWPDQTGTGLKIDRKLLKQYVTDNF